MNTKKSHKIFSLVMLILIVGSIATAAVVSTYNVIEYQHQLKQAEESQAAESEVTISEAN